MELGKPVTAVHGGAVARFITGEAFSATAKWMEALGSNNDAVRCSCARKEGERWNGGVDPLSRVLL
jgi:hypothetical protein